MTHYWWECPWCHHRTPSRLATEAADSDRDHHIASAHPTVLAWGAALLALHHYTHLEAHQ